MNRKAVKKVTHNPIVLTADLHLTSKDEDAYRWELFNALEAQCRELKDPIVVLLGDIADFKDKHDAEFVNQLTQALVKLGKVAPVHFVMGNHDMIKPEHPFFEYVNSFENVFYHKKPYALGRIMLLPYTKTPEKDWMEMDFSPYDFLLMHQPCIGSVSSEFYELTHGMSPSYFSEKHPEFNGMVFSGDIHIAQTVGDVNYVGAPYPIRMGDKITGGFITLIHNPHAEEEWSVTDVPFKTLRKTTIQIAALEGLFSEKSRLANTAIPPYKDFVQVKVDFSSEAYENWTEWKEKIRTFVVDVLGCTFKGVTLKSRNVDFSSVKSQASALSRINTLNKQEVVKTIGTREKLDDELLKVAYELMESK